MISMLYHGKAATAMHMHTMLIRYSYVHKFIRLFMVCIDIHILKARIISTFNSFIHINHRRPFNAWWRLLEISELTLRKYIRQGNKLKFW